MRGLYPSESTSSVVKVRSTTAPFAVTSSREYRELRMPTWNTPPLRMSPSSYARLTQVPCVYRVVPWDAEEHGRRIPDVPLQGEAPKGGDLREPGRDRSVQRLGHASTIPSVRRQFFERHRDVDAVASEVEPPDAPVPDRAPDEDEDDRDVARRLVGEGEAGGLSQERERGDQVRRDDGDDEGQRPDDDVGETTLLESEPQEGQGGQRDRDHRQEEQQEDERKVHRVVVEDHERQEDGPDGRDDDDPRPGLMGPPGDVAQHPGEEAVQREAQRVPREDVQPEDEPQDVPRDRSEEHDGQEDRIPPGHEVREGREAGREREGGRIGRGP